MTSTITAPERMHSIDFFRGITMFLLIGEFSGLFELLITPPFNATSVANLANQLHHHPWNGLRFWDLIQPFFMTIVGVSLALSVQNRKRKGASQHEINRHVAIRSISLLLLGWGLYCIDAGAITWRFQNVLAQLGITYPLAYLIMHRSFRFQALFAFALLLLTEALYRLSPIPDFNEAYTAGHNIGEWIEFKLNGAIPGGHWVSLNALPTAAHTIWGVLAGQWLLGNATPNKKLRMLFVFGLVLLISGYALNPITPIIKRIATSSFVLASGGWTILALALSYFVIDIKKRSKGVLFFAVVGMNPLFIYLFAHVGGAGLLERIVHPFTFVLMDWAGLEWAALFTSLVVWGLLWGICQWLYRKNLYFRI